MAITSILDITFKPELVASAEGRLHEILTVTRTRPGSQGVDVVVDVENPAHFLLIEHWESTQADADYRTWRSSPEGRSGLSDLLVGPAAASMYSEVFTI